MVSLLLVTILVGLVCFTKSTRVNQEPYFTNVKSWQMEENQPIGSRPLSAIYPNGPVILTAYDDDGDSLTFGIKSDPDSSYFTVDSKSGVVKLRKPFDREVVDHYVTRFSVSDGWNEFVEEVQIEILDVNDNAPLFERLRYNVTVPENAPIDSEVLRLTATDPDQGAGGWVTYELAEQDLDSPFRIDSSSGRLSLALNIDYEMTTSYRLVVFARDQDVDNPLFSSAVVTINIDDVQDTKPLFQGLPYDVSIDENIAYRTKVLTVSAIDGDRGNSHSVEFSLRSGNEDGKFLLESQGDIRVVRPLDRDTPGFSGIYRLTVRAWERSGNQLGEFSDVSFNVTINDVNDERPRFHRSRHRLALSENHPVGTSLPLTLQVTDIDQGVNSDVTISVDWHNRDVITVTPVSFRGSANVTIILTKALDFEETRKHSFKIFANESGLSELYTSCEIKLDVRNENDNVPVFEHLHYKVDMREDVPLDDPITRVVATDADSGRFGRVVYSIEGDEGVRINRTTGEVYLVRKLDYEETKLMQFVVTAQDSADDPLMSKSLLTINVLDANDNPPLWSGKVPEVFIKENIKGDIVAEIQATDADSHPFDVITYVIDDGPFSNYFSINSSENNVASLVIQEILDFEEFEDKVFTLSITALDEGFLSSSAPFVVHVVDENDNVPLFVGPKNFTVKENAGSGVRIGTIRAIDRDSGNNGQVFYYVTKGRSSFESVFEINEESGDVTTKLGASPDYEVMATYDVEVVARDGGNPSLSALQWIRINVEDENDNVPEFESSIIRVTVEENSELRDVRVNARDLDPGDNGRVRYKIVEDSVEGLFEIDDVTGDITATKEIDYEMIKGNIKLKVEAYDQGKDVSLSSHAEVIITIMDLNDNPPVFWPGPNVYYVMENVLGPPVGGFRADDADSGQNAKIIFSICGGNEFDRFAISPLDGDLRVRPGVELDREEMEVYNLTICATDAGSIPLQTRLSIRIQVLDANDNSPVFIRFPQFLAIEENRVERGVFRLEAVDPDEGDSGLVTFKIEGGEGSLTVDAETGIIDLVKPLDREIINEFLVHVTASDNPTNEKNSRSTRKQILIKVLDLNDEKPTFSQSSPYQATVREEKEPGTVIDYTANPLHSSDNDEGRNAEVTFSIVGESPYFVIDETSGIIRTAAMLDREALPRDVIELVVRASDVGGLYSETVVMVTVIDFNDNAPQFQQSRMFKVILECVQPGHVAARVTAFDPDQGSNGKVTYTVRSGSYDKFAINPQTGVIYLAPGQYLDREEKSTYRLKIVASDLAPEVPRSSTVEVLIKIEDVNDSRPKFLSSRERVEVLENSKIGKKIFRLRAIDDDVNSDLVYSMTSVTIYDGDGRPLVVDESVSAVMHSHYDDIMSWFYLNTTTGVISLASKNRDASTAVDREKCSSLVVLITVRDRASIRDEFSTCLQPIAIQFDVIDENDNAPQIDVLNNDVMVMNNEVIVDVREEVPVMTTVLAVSGFDYDQGSSGEVMFVLEDHPEEVFGLDTDNPGKIISISRIDREFLSPSGGSGWLNFTLVARDRDYSMPQTAKLFVRMRINDINDNPPVFSRGIHQVSLPENSEVGSVVMQLCAHDVDDGDFGDVTYRLFGAMNYFEIDRDGGQITLVKSLDYEARKEHVFTVIAGDSPRTDDIAHESSVQVAVTVDDVNDNSPVFIQPLQTSLKVFEKSARGSLITIVTATDNDSGDYGHVTYTISSQTDFFQIDRFNGGLSTSKRVVLSPSTPVVHNLTVTATDGGGVESQLDLQITLIDINDHVPQFNQSENSVVTIEEERPAGLFVAQVHARDHDLGLNGIVTYSLRETDVTDGAFHIDDASGQVITTRKLDREFRSSYSVIVEASDLGSPPLKSTKILTIRLLDIDDNQPVFPRQGPGGAIQSLSVDENVQPGNLIGLLQRATDRDENATIYYHILSVDDAMDEETFQIKKDQIFVGKPLNREVQDKYNLLIQASNHEKLEFSPKVTDPFRRDHKRYWESIDPGIEPSLLFLTINVHDAIDEAPQFSRHSYVTSVETETAPGAVVFAVEARDDDVNDLVTYSIIRETVLNPNNTSLVTNAFVINSKTGDVTTTKRLTDRAGSRYLLVLRVNDLQNLSDEATLELRVVRQSHFLQIVVESPPHVVKEKAEELAKVLENITGTVVKVDNVIPYMSSPQQSDTMRSEVSVRVFDAESNRETIIGKLNRNAKTLQQIFHTYFLRESRNQLGSSNDVIMLRAIVFILGVLFLLLLIIFLVTFCHLKRRHKEEIAKLQVSRNDDASMTSNKTFWKSQNSKEKTVSPETVESLREDDSASAKKMENNDLSAHNSLLWSPTLPRNKASSSQSGAVSRHETFPYQMPLHATTDDQLQAYLHGSDSVSSF